MSHVALVLLQLTSTQSPHAVKLQLTATQSPHAVKLQLTDITASPEREGGIEAAAFNIFALLNSRLPEDCIE